MPGWKTVRGIRGIEIGLFAPEKVPFLQKPEPWRCWADFQWNI